MLKRLLHMSLVAVAFFVALAVAMDAATFSSSYRTCEREESQATANTKQTNSNQAALNRVGPFLDCEAAFANVNGNAITGVATALLAAITLGLVWLAIDQSHTTRAQLRAYVFATQTDPMKRAAGKVLIGLKIRNGGTTPASNLHHWTAGGIRKKPYPTRFLGRAANSERPQIPMSAVIYHGVDLGVEIEVALDQFQFDDISEDQARVYVWGELEYRDIFRRSHTARFSFWAGGKDWLIGGLRLTEFGNDLG